MNNPAPESVKRQKNTIHDMAKAAVMTALLCVLSPLAIPVGPVPITLSVLIILFSSYILGWKKGTLVVLVYILIGLVGVPVFTGFTGGVGKVLGPTGGYIVGYIPMALIAGLAAERFSGRWLRLAGMAAGVLVLYVFGTAWLCLSADMTVPAALSVAVLPFVPFDAVKIVIAGFAGSTVKDRLKKAGIM